MYVCMYVCMYVICICLAIQFARMAGHTDGRAVGPVGLAGNPCRRSLVLVLSWLRRISYQIKLWKRTLVWKKVDGYMVMISQLHTGYNQIIRISDWRKRFAYVIQEMKSDHVGCFVCSCVGWMFCPKSLRLQMIFFIDLLFVCGAWQPT